MNEPNPTPKRVLTVVAVTATAIGVFALLLPGTLLQDVKSADPASSAIAMTRTVGVLLIAVGLLNFLVRSHAPTATLRAVLWADLALQVLLVPLDPLAYFEGAFGSIQAFAPNTLLHLGLIAVLAIQLHRSRAWASG